MKKEEDDWSGEAGRGNIRGRTRSSKSPQMAVQTPANHLGRLPRYDMITIHIWYRVYWVSVCSWVFEQGNINDQMIVILQFIILQFYILYSIFLYSCQRGSPTPRFASPRLFCCWFDSGLVDFLLFYSFFLLSYLFIFFFSFSLCIYLIELSYLSVFDLILYYLILLLFFPILHHIRPHSFPSP